MLLKIITSVHKMYSLQRAELFFAQSNPAGVEKQTPTRLVSAFVHTEQGWPPPMSPKER